ncbi:MAG: molybdenum cofactor guanylyltransferase MobA [Pseudomonadota bacterium]
MTQPAKSVVLGVVLAGGQSRRMGEVGKGDKALMPLDGKPLLAHALERLDAVVDRVVINANGDPARFAAFDRPVIADTIPGYAGPLAGVLAAMHHAKTLEPKPDYVLSVAGDTPFFPKDLVDAMVTASGKGEIVLAESDGRRHPVFGLWPVRLCDDLDAWLRDQENRKVLAWVGRHDWTTCEFEPVKVGQSTLDPFFNINTPEDFAFAEGLMEETV